MNKKCLKSIILSILLTSAAFNVDAKQNLNANPWGYSGLINMPTADTLGFGEFYITGNYLFRNPGFMINAHMGIFDRLELGIVGGIPSAGFSGLAGNLKYQLIKPTSKMPTSLAVGLSLIGLANDTKLTTGNSLYMVLSQDFNWQMPDKSIYNLFSGHVGFSGNFNGSRIMFGVDVPVTEYVTLNGEFLGKVGSFDEMINFGIKAKPLPWLGVSFLTTGTSTKGFGNTDYLLNVSYNGNIPFMQYQANKEEDKIAVNSTPTPVLTPKPVKTPEIVEPVETPIPPAPSVIPTQRPIVRPTAEPEPTVIPAPVKTPQAVVETPIVKSTPEVIAKATPAPKVTPEPEKKSTTGVLKGDIKGSMENIKPSNVNITIKGIKSAFQKKMVSDSQGNYTFNDLPKGEYNITFQKEGFSEVTKQVFVNSGDTTEVNIEMNAVNGSISGRLLDTKGNPLEEVVLSLDKGKKALTQRNGKFYFSDVTAGYHLLTVYADGKEIKSFDMDIMAGTELTKELIVDMSAKKPAVKTPVAKTPEKVETKVAENKPETKPVENSQTPQKKGVAGIGGKITDKNGDLKGARVMFEGDKLTVMTISGDDGSYNVKNIAIGTYKMTISKAGYITRVFSVKIKDAKQAVHNVKLNME